MPRPALAGFSESDGTMLNGTAESLRKIVLGTCGLIALAVSSASAQPAASPPDYQQHIVPVLKKYCYGCHDADGAEGGLVLDSFAALMKGGKRGASVIPGSSERSRLVRVLTGAAAPKMPPDDNVPPKEHEIALLRSWIDAGAKGPSGTVPVDDVLVTPFVAPKSAVNFAVHALAFAPDNKLVALAGYQEVRLLDPATNQVVRTLGGHTGNVTSVSFSKKGQLIVTASGEPGLFGEARIYRASDGQLLKKFRHPQDSLYAAELSPDEQTLATAGYNYDIVLWDANKGTIRNVLKGHNGCVNALAFSPDGTKLVSASADATAKLWDVKTGERLETFGQSLAGLNTVTFSPDGKRVAAGGIDNRVRIWQVSETAKEGTNPILFSRFAHQGPILRLVFSPDGKLLASSSEDQTVKVWDALGAIERYALPPQPDWPSAITFSSDSKSLLVGRFDGTLTLYQADNGTKKADVQPKFPVPELQALWPPGLTRGQATKVLLKGKDLAGATELKVSSPHVQAKLLRDEQGAQLWAEVTVAADAARGPVELSVVTPGGTSGGQKLYVEELPQVEEIEPNDLPSQATAGALPVSFWGTFSRKGDIDHFAFEGKSGQFLVLDVSSQSLGTKVNAVVNVFDAEARLLASNNDYDGQADPFLHVTIPADGKYVIEIRDLLLDGGPANLYRLTVGSLPYVTGHFPLSIPAEKQSAVSLIGYHLPADAQVLLTAGKQGDLAVPLDANRYRWRGTPKVLIGTFSEVLEVEPNDKVKTATVLTVPTTVNGRFEVQNNRDSTDADLYKFTSRKGQEWILETDAARRGSPADTKLEVLDAQGLPIPRLLLQATRDSYINFRPINSLSPDVRVKNWEEMELNEYMYFQGEVCKIFRMPQGPDSGFMLYSRNGQRICYFDTSPTTHALFEPCYIVTPHAPGTSLVPNGLPTFPVYYANDDSGDRGEGTDSRLTFVAPADGDYWIRVTDSRGYQGERFAYRLTVRERKPDFQVRLTTANPTVASGSGTKINVAVERLDGFADEIRVDVTGLPPGFSLASPLVIQAGHDAAQAALLAAPDAVAPTSETNGKTELVAKATIGGQEVARPVNGLGMIKLSAKPQLIVRMEPAEVVIRPGQTISLTLKVERNGFKDRIRFDVENLPHGVIVDNIGLSGILIPAGQDERQIFLNARNWVPETDRPFFAVARAVGDQASPPVVLKVRKQSTLAQGQ